jgi:hypothetical protein
LTRPAPFRLLPPWSRRKGRQSSLRRESQDRLEHARLVEVQRKKRGWKGYAISLPNCTTMGLVMTLKPIFAAP